MARGARCIVLIAIVRGAPFINMVTLLYVIIVVNLKTYYPPTVAILLQH